MLPKSQVNQSPVIYHFTKFHKLHGVLYHIIFVAPNCDAQCYQCLLLPKALMPYAIFLSAKGSMLLFAILLKWHSAILTYSKVLC